jgi:hypothetical protein
MSRTVEIPARSVPLRMVLVLSICLAGLLVHFYAENLAPAAQPFGMEWIGSGETERQSHDTGEDLFILPEFTGLKTLQNSIRAIYPEALVFSSIPFRPLLPPPIKG